MPLEPLAWVVPSARRDSAPHRPCEHRTECRGVPVECRWAQRPAFGLVDGLAVGVVAGEVATALRGEILKREENLIVCELGKRDGAESDDPPAEPLRARDIAARVLGHVSIHEVADRDLSGSRGSAGRRCRLTGGLQLHFHLESLPKNVRLFTGGLGKESGNAQRNKEVW